MNLGLVHAFSLTVFLTVVPLFARGSVAGGSDGGGGKGVVCRNLNGSIQSVELLDLWESKEIHSRKVLRSKVAAEEQVKVMIESLKYAVQISDEGAYIDEDGKTTVSESEDLRRHLTMIAKLFTGPTSKYVRRLKGKKLVLTNDSFEAVQPTGRCTVEQIVSYIDSQTMPIILVNQDLLSKMDSTHQAALYLHEGFYLYLRGYNKNGFNFRNYRETNSIRTRRAIGYVFAGNRFRPLESLIGRRYVRCEGNDKLGGNPSNFYLYRDAQGNHRHINTQVFGKPAIGFFPELQSTFVTIESAVGERSCNEPYQEVGMGPGAIGIAGAGPVDFQMMNWVTSACLENKWALYIQQDSSNRSEANVSQRMFCRLIEK